MSIEIRRQKVSKLLASLLFAALIAYLGFYFAMKEAAWTKSDRKESMLEADLPRVDEKSKSFSVNHTADTSVTETVEARSPQEIAVVDGWFKQVGFSTEAQRSYEQQYTDEQLKRLADKGDTTAIDTLTSRYIARGQSELVIPLSEKGIIYGSFNSIQAIMYRYASILDGDDSEEVRKQNKENLKQYLSYLGLMNLRGAGKLYATHIDEKTQLNYFKEKYGEKEPLTTEDYNWISSNSHKLYDHYQAERHKLGLGDYDNSKPKEVESFFAK